MTKYLLDSNIYINFYERCYDISYFPTFWQNIIPIMNNFVILPTIIIGENYQNPWFKQWIQENYIPDLINHKKYAAGWGEVLNHVRTCGYYNDAAISSEKGWAREKVADPWIIAIAKAEGLTIVTQETRNPSLGKGPAVRAAKIPDVCDDLSVRCISMNEFFGEVGLSV